jgi:hypothetical protein
MPCYTVSKATVQFGKNTDVNLLQAALAQIGIDVSLYPAIVQSGDESILGYGIRFNRVSGVLTIRGNDAIDVAQVKRAYSEQVVNATAKKNGWAISWQTNSAGNRVAQVERISR